MNRLEELNGTVKPRKEKKQSAPRQAKPRKPDFLHRYAYAGVVIMAALSAFLNGYANAQHSPSQWAGWGMGLVIPAIILILGKVASLLYKRNKRQGAYVTGGVGIGLLFLSVWHCSASIAALTGSPLLLAMPMAVAIDCGFVCCEVATLLE